MKVEVLAAENGIVIEFVAVKGLNCIGMLKFDSHFDGSLDVY